MSLGMQEILPNGGLASFQNHVSRIADLGRYEDAYIVHAAEGETVVPMAVFDENPRLKAMLFAQMRGMGIDPQQYIVGNELNSINPVTGQPEFFLKKIFKSAKKALKSIAPYAGVIAGAMGAGPWASAGIGALGGYYGEGDMGGALKGGLYGYTAGKGFGSRFGDDANYVFKDGFKGSLGRIGENFGMLPKGNPAEIKKAQALVDAAETTEQLEFAKKKLAMVKPGFLERMAGMDWPTKGLLGATAAYGLSDIMKAGENKDEGMPNDWYNIYPSNPWYGNWAADGGIIQKFDNGGEVDPVEIKNLMEYHGMTYEEAKEYLDSIKDMNTGGIINAYDNGGPVDMPQEGYPHQ